MLTHIKTCCIPIRNRIPQLNWLEESTECGIQIRFIIFSIFVSLNDCLFYSLFSVIGLKFIKSVALSFLLPISYKNLS